MAVIHSLNSLHLDTLLLSADHWHFVGKESFVLAGFDQNGLEVARVRFARANRDNYNPLDEESLKGIFVEYGGLLNKLPRGLLAPEPLSQIRTFAQDGQYEVHISPVNDNLFPNIWLEPYPLTQADFAAWEASLHE